MGERKKRSLLEGKLSTKKNNKHQEILKVDLEILQFLLPLLQDPFPPPLLLVPSLLPSQKILREEKEQLVDLLANAVDFLDLVSKRFCLRENRKRRSNKLYHLISHYQYQPARERNWLYLEIQDLVD